MSERAICEKSIRTHNQGCDQCRNYQPDDFVPDFPGQDFGVLEVRGTELCPLGKTLSARLMKAMKIEPRAEEFWQAEGSQYSWFVTQARKAK